MEQSIHDPSSGYESSHLQRLYKTVPHWRSVLEAVRAGRAEFARMLASNGLSDFGCSTSEVHPDGDIELHAFILGIVSDGRPWEIQTKAFLTYASHWIDDFFDNPRMVPDPDQLFADRKDIRVVLARMGSVGNVGFAMANRAVHPEAIYKTLHRMLYGGLVQRSLCRSERQRLVQEYPEIGTRFVNEALVERIRQLQPEAYWTTNKSVLEISYAAERDIDFTVAELWNLLYSSALYYQDAAEERVRGELNFDDDEAPRLSEMLKMVKVGAEYLGRLYGKSSPQMQQLRFLTSAMPELPEEIAGEYQSLWMGEYGMPPSSRPAPVMMSRSARTGE